MKNKLLAVWLFTVLAITARAGSSLDFGAIGTVTSNSATVNMVANYGGASDGTLTIIYIEWTSSTALTSTLWQSAVYYATFTQLVPLGSSTNVLKAYTITGLTPSTTYYYTAAGGVPHAPLYSFTTAAAAPPNYPTLSTPSVSSITPTSMVLSATISNPVSATVWFDQNNVLWPAAGFTVSGTTNLSLTITTTNLTPLTAYTNWLHVFWNGITYLDGTNVVVSTLSSTNSYFPASFIVPPPFDTLAASPVTNTVEAVSVQVNPNGFSNLVWFTYGTPTISTQTVAVQIGNGSSPVTISLNISNLIPSTQYQLSAKASNGVNAIVTYPNIQYFTTAAGPIAPPTAITTNEVNITASNVTLRAVLSPTVSPSTAYFRWNTNSDVQAGWQSPTVSGISAGLFQQGVTLAVSGATYFVTSYISDGINGTTIGTTNSFIATNTLTATALTTSNAFTDLVSRDVWGQFNPYGAAGYTVFMYFGDSPLVLTNFAATSFSSGTGVTFSNYQFTISGLTTNKAYYYRLEGINGTNIVSGSVSNFTIIAPMGSALTLSNVSVNASNQTVFGEFNPLGVSGYTAEMLYGPTSPPLNNGGTFTADTSNTNTIYSFSLTGLTPGSNYFYQIIGTNSSPTTPTAYGGISNFTAAALGPVFNTVVTNYAINVTTNSATLIAGLNIVSTNNASEAFVYGTDSNMMIWSSAPTVLSTLGSVTVTQNITVGIVSGATNYFQAMISDPSGKPLGVIESFVATNTSIFTVVALSNNSSTVFGYVNPAGAGVPVNAFYGTATNAMAILGGPITPTVVISATGATNTYFSTVIPVTAGYTNYCFFAARQSAFVPITYSQTLGFFIPALPSITTPNAPSAITQSNASFTASIVPQLKSWQCSIRFTNAGIAFFSTPIVGLALNTSAGFSQLINGLAPSTTYGFYAYAFDSSGTNILIGATNLFVTSAASAPIGTPTYSLSLPSGITTTSAVLAATVIPNGFASTAWFDYGSSPSSPTYQTTNFNIGSGATPVYLQAPVNNLSPGSPYYYNLIVTNVNGAAPHASSPQYFSTYIAGGQYGCIGDQLQTLDQTRPYDTEPGSVLGAAVRQVKCDLLSFANVKFNPDGTFQTGVIQGSDIGNGQITAVNMDSGFLRSLTNTVTTNVVSSLVTNALTWISDTGTPSALSAHSAGTANDLMSTTVNGSKYSKVILTADIWFSTLNGAPGAVYKSWFYFIVGGTPQSAIMTNGIWGDTTQVFPLSYIVSGVGSNVTVEIRGGSTSPATKPTSARTINFRIWGIP